GGPGPGRRRRRGRRSGSPRPGASPGGRGPRGRGRPGAPRRRMVRRGRAVAAGAPVLPSHQEAVMGPIGPAVLIAAALAGGADPAPAVDPAHFRGWFDEAAAGRLRIPAAVEARARRLRYVLVGGFRSERMPGYFAQNIKELEARGVPAAAIHAIYPSSHATAEENRDAIRARFRAIADARPEPLVVIRP